MDRTTIEQAIAIIGKELGFKKFYAEKEIKRYPFKESRLRGELAAMELGLKILKEVRDKKAFLKLNSL